MVKAIEVKNYYCIPSDNRNLNYGKYISEGEEHVSEVEEYNSHNTDRLDVNETKELLLKLLLNMNSKKKKIWILLKKIY